MPPGTLIIRADATVAMGTGHVMRCLALAQAWQDKGGQCVFAMAEGTPAIQERLRSEKFDVACISMSPGSPQDVGWLVELALTHQASWIVVDGYQFDVEYQRTLKAAGLKVLVVDDTGRVGAYVSDLVLDQNAHGSESFYQNRESDTRLLLGPRYAMLRREFKPWRGWKREISPVGRKVLITMGGSDPQNLTLRVIEALKSVKVEGVEIIIVAGGSNPHVASLEHAISKMNHIRLQKNVTNMADLLAWADLAVSGAGSICWELCMLGLPAILLDAAENQRPIARELDRQAIAIYLGRGEEVPPEEIKEKLEWLLLSPDVRGAMSARGQSLVDGSGAERVIAAMAGAGWRLRRVQPADCDLLWEWVNDPGVRAASFSSDVITRERHLEWFGAKLADPNAILYVAMDANNSPVGLVRYDLERMRALISISLAAGFRRQGHGSALLALAVEELFRSTSATAIDAYVKPTNEASLRVFTRAGFLRQEGVTFAEQPAVHFTLEKKRIS